MPSTVHTGTPFNEAPAWSRKAIWYQIFTERFYNGDKGNDPEAADINIPSLNETAPADWAISSWTSDWYAQEGWGKGMPFNDVVHRRRYGGDLQGVLDKLDYLQELGVTALYMNPLNSAPSAHKYDASYYHHIDVNFGPDPEGDKLLMASEDPSDHTTWKWTAADRLFLQLVAELHRRNMRIIVDFSWNHTGVLFWAWQDVLKKKASSAYCSWYEINSQIDPATPEVKFDYTGWEGIMSMPELRKVNLKSERIGGQPYEGDINEGAKQHILAVIERWLSPNGNVSQGIDGFRLDVADQVGLAFWRDFRKAVRDINPDAYLLGEVWWENWPDKLMNPEPYLRGDIFDGIMFYQVYRPARYFFADTSYELDAREFREALEFEWNRLPADKRYSMMNVSSSHDAPRLLTDFYNANKYKFLANANEDPAYKTGKPDRMSYQRVRLYLVHLFTSIGAPQIWNGEEMGMWGGDDPDTRKPLWWKEYTFEDENRNNLQPIPPEYDELGFNEEQFLWYQKLITIRKNNPVLIDGEIEFLKAEGKALAYRRYDSENELLVCFNLESFPVSFDLAAGASYIDLLNENQQCTGEIELAPFRAALLLRASQP
jgi:cyclomaltodextrinase